MIIELYDKLGNKIGEARSITVEREMNRHHVITGIGGEQEFFGPASINIELKDVAMSMAMVQGDIISRLFDVKLSEPNTENLWFRDCYVMEWEHALSLGANGESDIISRVKLAVRETNAHFPQQHYHMGVRYDSAKTEAWLERWHRR